MEPKPAAPATVAGAPRGGVFVTLNASARNSTLRFSPKYVRLISAMSAFRYCGPRTGLRELLSIVNGGIGERGLYQSAFGVIKLAPVWSE